MVKSKKGRKASEAASLLAKLRAELLTPEQRQEQARKAGKARLTKMTPEQRKAIAKKAAAARWGKKRKAR